MRPKVLAICGPTGVGKTKVSIEIAKEFSGEIINFDSQQFYRELTIGTGKPGPSEQEGIPHHLFDVATLEEEMTAGKFVELADPLIREISERGNLPILVGGTGLYLRALEYGLFKVEIDKSLREELKEKAKENLGRLYEELARLDPEYARKIHPHDRVRILRALEVIYSTGKPFSAFHRESPFFKNKRYPLLKLGLNLPRKELYAKINARVESMLDAGWLEEVKTLRDKYGKEIFTKIKAIGYKTLLKVLEGELSLDEAKRIIQRDTRRYAKRQLTWFRRDPDLEWFHPEELHKIFARVELFLKEA